MDSNDLLASTRTEFFAAFVEAMCKAQSACAEELYRKADASYSSADQARLLNARAVLLDKWQSEFLSRELSAAMERLLNRSFQTTYSTFRPNSSISFQADSLSLIDATVFEDELRIDDMTSRFRGEAEELLRDLNIRIALLFGQAAIKERENPFRPYLFSRTIVTALETLGLSSDIGVTLRDQLTGALAPFISSIYSRVNAHLAKHGIAAQLQMKIKKSPTVPGLHATDADALGSMNTEAEPPSQPISASATSDGTSDRNRTSGLDLIHRAMEADQPARGVDQLFQSVRERASGVAPIHSAGGHPTQSTQQSHQSASNAAQQAAPATDSQAELEQKSAEPKFSWLNMEQSVGSVLRKFFSPSGIPDNEHGFVNSRLTPASTSSGETQAEMAVNNAQPRSSDTAHSQTASQAGSTGAPLSQSVSQLQRETPATTQMFDGRGEVRNLILEQRASLAQSTESVDDQMTIDVVAMLFEFILRDNQIPAEVRAQLGRLQFLVLKIALRDASLLTQKGHPARMLVNRIGSISLGLKQIDPSGVQITEEICRIVETLLRDDSENPQIFSKMLDEFDAFIARELRAANKDVEGIIQAVEQVQSRTLRFAHIVAQIAEVLMGLTIDPYLQQFLEGTWVHAIEVAETKDAKQARRFRLLVPDLLWSIVPKATKDDNAQLFVLLPIIISTLRDGLALIAWSAAQQQELLDWLVDAHTKALRSAQQDIKPPSLPTLHEHFDRFTGESESNDSGTGDITLDSKDIKQFLDEAIKHLDLQVQMLDPLFDEDMLNDANEVLPENVSEAQTVLEKLRNGVAIELHLGVKPSQGRLIWVDPSLSNMVLSINGETAPSIIGVRVFRRMLEKRRVRFLENEPIFDRAIESLLKSADKMDGAAALQ